MGKKGCAVKKRRGNGVSAPRDANDTKRREMKRKLGSSTSQLDPVDEVDCGVGYSSFCGEGSRNETADVEKKKKEVFASEEISVSDNKQVAEAEFVTKQRGNTDAEVPSKMIKLDSWEQGEKDKSLLDVNKPPQTLISQSGTDKIETNAGIVGGSDPLVPANRKVAGVGENQIQIRPEKAGKEGAENTKSMKSPGNFQKLGGNDHHTSGGAGDRRAEIDISRSQDRTLKVQGKADDALRVLRSNKVGGFEKYYIRRKYKGGIPKDINSVFLARATLNEPALSPSERVDENSNFTSTMSKNELSRSKHEIPKKSGSGEPKKQQKIVSPDREKRRVADTAKSKTALRTKSRSSTETSFKKKQASKVGGVSHITEKQKLRAQIKSILVAAGWTIDLRPRRGRDYEDSVYIPPEGGSGYWSITKAYAIYQNKLSITNNVVGKTSSGRSSRTSASQSVVPLESLALLKRVVVNKRRRKAEETEKFQEGRMKRVKQASYKSHLRDQVKGKLASNSKFSYNSTSHKNVHKGLINKRGGHTILVRGGHNELEADDADYVPYVWKRTILSWMIDMGVLPINGKVKYMNQQKTKTMLEGWITREGINCSCCRKILPISEFELHAGSELLHPSQNIFLEDGEISLFLCKIEAWKKQVESERQGYYYFDVSCEDPNDDICGICGDGGSLMCCDACPSTFHLNCLGIEKPPPGDWYCTNCCCKYCGIPSGGTDGAVLFSCHQCEARYHKDCTPCPESDSAIPKCPTISFCAKSCRMVFSGLQELLGTKHDIDAGLSWSVVRCFDDVDSSELALRSRQGVECNSKIAVAFAVMNECFLPIVDKRSGINLIHGVVYNCRSNLRRMNFQGFYTFTLEREDEIISVASIRIFGTRFAEMPFIGTRNMYRRQGMCHQLLSGIESALSSLNVEKLVIPAISELKDTWINVFGFRPLEVSQEVDARSINILVFPGTGLLQKQLLKSHSSENMSVDGVRLVKYDIEHHKKTSTHDSSEALCAILEFPYSAQTVGSCRNATEIERESSDHPAEAINCKSFEYKSSENAGDVSMNTYSKRRLTVSHSENKSQVDLTTDQKTLIDSSSDAINQEEYGIVSKQTPNVFASAFQNPKCSLPVKSPIKCKIFQDTCEDHRGCLDSITFKRVHDIRENMESIMLLGGSATLFGSESR
ncbi:uncharacterized protein LOC121992374 isoform X1 [Zingiber officinale]|nr:uncharacterized protein LOC121992374 isoform X1 [Zingiber officinale]XP_042402628.1 uncharacterized protein LOC121992374 isoform X1 [Zingiber officinale]